MSDILLFSEHSDPQIRGGIIILVGSFLNAATLESKGFDLDWLSSDESKLNFKNLLNIIYQVINVLTLISNATIFRLFYVFLSFLKGTKG